MQSAVRPPSGSGDDPGYSYFSDGKGWQSAPGTGRAGAQPPAAARPARPPSARPRSVQARPAATVRAVTRRRSTAAAPADTAPPGARTRRPEAARAPGVPGVPAGSAAPRPGRPRTRWPRLAGGPGGPGGPVRPGGPAGPGGPRGPQGGTASARAAGGGTGPGRRRPPSPAAWSSSSCSPCSAATSTCRAARRSRPRSRRPTTRTRPSTTATARRSLGTFGATNRQDLTYAQIPPKLQNAVVAAEDKGFWTEGGISPTGILRAAYPRRDQQRRQERRLHDHPGVRPELLRRHRHPADGEQEDQGDLHRPEAVRDQVQAVDPDELPEPDLPWRELLRGRGGRADLLRRCRCRS